jgi:hypothetical protein
VTQFYTWETNFLWILCVNRSSNLKFYNRTNIYHNFFIAWYYFFWKSGSNEYKNVDDNISLMSNQRILNLFIVYKIMIIIYEILTSNKLNRKNIFWFVFFSGLWCLTPLSTIFHYIVAISFIGGGNRSSRRKPPTCRKSLTNFIT